MKFKDSCAYMKFIGALSCSFICGLSGAVFLYFRQHIKERNFLLSSGAYCDKPHLDLSQGGMHIIWRSEGALDAVT